MSNLQLHNILKQFDTITLEEMDNVKLMNRVDTKFIFSIDKLIELLPLFQEHYRILCIEDKLTPSYESIYYDSEDLDFYNEHHRKRVDRFKVRYRKYIESNISFLEVKHKNKGRTDKSRIVVDDLTYKMPLEHFEFVKGTGVSNDELKAVLVNRFNRMTLVAKESVERLTIDINLEFESRENNKAISHIVIAELKQEKMTRTSPFFQIAKAHQIRPYRISKYCIGIIKLFGKENVKYNRFKKKLLKIDKLKTHAA